MGKKGGQSQGTQTMKLDKATQQYVEQMRRNALAQYGNLMSGGQLFSGPTAGMVGGLQNLGQAFGQNQLYQAMSAQAAQSGLNYGGDPLAMQQAWQSPYQQQVIDAMQPQFDRQMSSATLRANDLATKAGAFGGSRHAVLEAEMRRGLAQDQNQQVANLLQQGFGQSSGLAMQQYGMDSNRALQLSNLGFGNLGRSIGMQGAFAGQQFGFGDQMRQVYNQQLQEELYRAQQGLGMLQGSIGPYGQTTSATGPGGNLLGGVAGGAIAGSAFGPVGAIAGGGLGLLGGLFG